MPEFSHKSEKLASAVYLITSFFNEQEPLKWKLRALASELVSLSVSLKEYLFKDRESSISETKITISKISALLLVAKNSGLISAENYELMEREFTNCISMLDYPLNISDFLSIESPKPRTKELSDNLMIKDKNDYRSLDRSSLKGFGAVSVKKNSRQSVIISLLKRKKEVMIKDVSPLIEGCSEKTIQRELTAMVRSGLIKRMGEKRWSRYSLA